MANIYENTVIPNGAVPQPNITPAGDAIANANEARTAAEGQRSVGRSGFSSLAEAEAWSAYQADLEKQGKPMTTLGSSEGEKIIKDIQTKIAPPVTDTGTKTETKPTATQQTEADLLKSELDATKTDLQKQADNAKASFKATLDPIRAEADFALQGQLTAIDQQFDQLVAKQTEINRRNEKTSETIQLRGGTARYAPEAAMGAVNATISEGANKISELNAKRAEAKANVQNAFNEQKYTLGLKEFDYYNQIDKEMRAEVSKLNEKILEANKEAAKTQRVSNIETSVSSLMASGVTNPQSIFAAVSSAMPGASTEEVRKAIDNLTPKESKETTKNAYTFTTEAAGKLLSAGLTGQEIQNVQDIFNKSGLYNPAPELDGKSLSEILPPKTLGVVKNILFPPIKTGSQPGDLDYDTSILVARLGKQIYGTRISDLETKKVENFVTQGTTAGKNEYQIIDDVLGYKVTRNQTLADSLRNTLLASSGPEGLAGQDMMGLARLINSNQDLAAVQKVENTKMLEAQDLVGRENFVNESDVTYVKQKADEIVKLLGEGWTDEVGAFTGTFDTWLSRKFGIGQAGKIKAKITSLTADLVNKRAGSALTDTEWKRLIEPNVPQMNDAGTMIKDKLNELVDNPLAKLNAERKMVFLPELGRAQIDNPASKIKLYTGNTDEDPLGVTVGKNVAGDPLNLGI